MKIILQGITPKEFSEALGEVARHSDKEVIYFNIQIEKPKPMVESKPANEFMESEVKRNAKN